MDGIKLDSIDVSQLVIKNKTKIFPDLLGTGLTEFLVSERLRDFLIENVKAQEINFVKVKITKFDYWLINIVNLRDCMDYEQSEYTVYKKVNKPDQITNLVVKEDQISELDMFRISDRPEMVFVTESLKKLLEDQGFTGIRFFGGANLTVF